MENASFSIHRATTDAGFYPPQCRQGLAMLLDKCSARQFPLVFWYISAADEGFKTELALALEKVYSQYEELD